MKNTMEPRKSSIVYYPDGVMVRGLRINGKAGKGGKRGTIKGWSRSSRRRSREFLLFNHIPEDSFSVMGVTLTIPGPVPSVEESKDLWKDWCNRQQMEGWCLFWRLEVQQRGSMHWHLLCGVPRIVPDPQAALRKSWMSALERMPVVKLKKGDKYPCPGFKGAIIYGESTRNDWPFAEKYAVHSELSDAQGGSWKRYLQDHATKAKQEQIAEGIGRHWGVVGRKHFVRREHDGVDKLSDKAFARFLRAYQRLCTPVRRNKRVFKPCPFGKRLGSRVRRGSWGSSVWYSNPDTVKKLVAWAASTEA